MPSPTTAPAAISARGPTVARWSTIAPIPTSAPSPIRQPSSIAMWPIVTFSPTIVGRSSAQWITQLSCTLEPAPITIALLSPRRTAPNQMRAPGETVTSPISTAVGATNASSATCGVLPSSSITVAIAPPPPPACAPSVPTSRLCARPSATIPLSRSTLAASHSSRFAAA